MSFNISVIAGPDANSSSASIVGGSLKHIITSQEKSTFNLGDSSLKSAVNAYFGRRPNDAYLHSPTPWGDLYQTYGWEQVTTWLHPQSANIMGINTEPVIVKEATFRNNSSVPADFDVSVSDQVQHTSSHTWSQSNSVEFTQSFKYEIGFLGTGGGGETSMSYNHTWGESKTESKTVTVGSTSGVVVRLEPGQAVVARLSATRGFLDVRITYRASLSGYTAVNYDPRHQGHHFWALGINSVMPAGGLPNTKTITEDMRIGYYSNSEIELVDPQSGRVLARQSLDARVGDDPEKPIVMTVPSPALA
jgi:hypothetical protein